jgi:hypothetical protein
MGFLDRFTGKKQQPAPAREPAPPAASYTTASAPAEKAATVAGGVIPRLQAARARLDARDLAGAMTIYEEVFAGAGDRADVLLTASGDLGTHGHVREIIELVAPRYDAQRHGPAAGLNLLQAYIVSGQHEAAQHLLDLLFALGRPELEERLLGFSNAIAEMMVAETSSRDVPSGATQISLVSISKPIWFYGLEESAPRLLPAKEGRRRRLAFGQLAILGDAETMEKAKKPEDELGRFTRGFPLWMAETFFYTGSYDPAAGIGVFAPEHFALFPLEWTADNIRQLDQSTEGGVDYVLTGAVRDRNGDFELTLRIWELKKFRELKSFTTRWTPSTIDQALREFHELVRRYMEWAPLPPGNGLAYQAPAMPSPYIQALGGSLGLFLAEKQMLAAAHVPADASLFLRSAQANPDDARAQLMLVTAIQRLRARGVQVDPAAMQHASSWLESDAARNSGITTPLL